MFKELPLVQSKLGIGTAQFGEKYGLSKTIRPKFEDVYEILKIARSQYLEIIDTAPGYEKSEELLGRSNLLDDFKVVTKFAKSDFNLPASENKRKIIKRLKKSLNLLGLDKIYGILIHNVDDLDIDSGNYIKGLVTEVRESQLVSKVGISVYKQEDIERTLEIFKPDIIQLPVNIFDQRLINSGHIKYLSRMNIEVHARSILLQGLILKNKNYLLKKSPQHIKIIEQLQKRADEFGCSVIELATSFVNSIEGVNTLILGIRSPKQLSSFLKLDTRQINIHEFKDLSQSDIKLIDPREWK